MSSKLYKGSAVECGKYKAIVESVKVTDNSFYEDDKPESGWNSPFQYSIVFKLESGQQFTQAFVRPDEDSLFGQLYQLAEAEGLATGESVKEIDEQVIVGVECEVEVVENKKGYATVYEAWSPDAPKDNPNATEEEKEEAKEEAPAKKKA